MKCLLSPAQTQVAKHLAQIEISEVTQEHSEEYDKSYADLFTSPSTIVD